LKRGFLLGLFKGVIRRTIVASRAVGRESPLREDCSTEAEKWSLLEVVTRQLLVKTLRALVVCKVWKLGIAL
jgi:hypothetical protein